MEGLAMVPHGEWYAHKSRLAEKGLVRSVFMNLHLVTFQASTASDFEPLLLDRNAQRLSELVDRCLAIRKDIRELEILEVKAATDYVLFNTTSVLDEQIDILRLQIPSMTNEQAGFEKAAAAFSATSTLEKGLTEIALGRDAALGENLKSSGSIRDLITARWKSLHAYQDAYHAQYTEPGNAHNYGERAALLLEVMTTLMQEALARATALAAGVKQVYGTQLPPVPVNVDLQSIDQFAIWSLKAVRALSRTAEQETVSDIVIPLVQPWLSSQNPLIREDDFNKAVSDATAEQSISLSFDLPNGGFLDPKTRVKGIGASFGNNCEIVAGSGIDRNQTVDAFTRLAIRISTPAQLAGDGSTYFRPPLLIGNVALHGVVGIGSAVEGNAIENISPFGKWKIEIRPLFVWKDGKTQIISNPSFGDPIKDLKLTLRVYIPGQMQ